MKQGRRINQFNRDNAIMRILQSHKGRANSISSTVLAKELKELGFSANEGTIRGDMKRIMWERHTPICFANSKGYYLPECKSDIEAVIVDLQSRITEMNAHIDFLKGFIF